MKKVSLLLALSCIFTNLLFAQSAPEGMNYQAVARNLKGEILATQPISLRVLLFNPSANGNTDYYTEVHDVVTSTTGVFSLVIGKGRKEDGSFATIPWSKENIWMEVSIKSRGETGFGVISNSRLLAVPYAFHALTAEKLSELGNSAGGSPANNWMLAGNGGTNPLEHKLGTSDSVDLVMVTNNIERIRVFGYGDVLIQKNVRIKRNLTVDSSTYLNTIGGVTINYGPFTVENLSPTLLSGTLTVDEETDLNSSLNVDGITNLQSHLNVNNESNTKLTGHLQVEGITDLDSSLNVNGANPTVLTGTLRVDLDADFMEKLKVNSTYQTDTAALSPSGSLQVLGGGYVGMNFYVGGTAKFGGPVAFGGAVSINDLTQSVNTTTGALIVKGGVGIAKRLNVGEGVLFGSTLGVTGITTVTNNTQSTVVGNGALVVAGGAGITRNVNIGGTLTTAGITTLNNVLNVNVGISGYVANFVNNNNSNGISIQVAAATPGNANNYVTFKNSGGATVGRIEGETLAQLQVSPQYLAAKQAFIVEVVTGSVDAAIAVFEVAQAGVGIAAAASSSTACVGFGACITAPIPSFIIASGTNLVLKIANAASEAASLVQAIESRNQWVSTVESTVGVTYQSGAGDYAEWLPKANPSEVFMPGYVVGMKNGKISMNTIGADKLFVISTKPIVLGNMPADGKESGYEKVAFMGQVPVRVLGKVNAGDYILPSGKNNGLAIAVSPDKMKPEDYTRIVGVAWSASTNDIVGQVNTAIGLNTGDVSKVVAEQSKEINDLRSKISETNMLLAKLVPGFKEAAGINDVVVKTVPSVTGIKDNHANHRDVVTATSGDIVYFELSNDQLAAIFAMAEKIFLENGGDMTNHPFWQRIKSEPGFKEATMQQVSAKFKSAVHTHQDVNKQFLRGK